MSGPATGGSNSRSSGFSLDRNGEARLALREILRDYGLAGIDDDALIARHVPDLLPGAPREAGLLRAAASAQVGHLLTDRFGAHMPTEAAVRDVAAILAERTALDANACLWIVTEYAAALGHPVEAPPIPAQPAALDQAGADPASGAPPAAPAGPPHQPPHQPGGRQPVGPGFPPAGQRPTGQAFQAGRAVPVFIPSGPDYSGSIPVPRQRSKAPLIIGIVVVVAVIVAAIGIALAFQDSPGCTTASCTASTHSSHPPTHKPTPTTTHTPTPTPSTRPSSTPTNPSTVTSLRNLLPKDIDPDNAACDSDDANNQLDGTSAFYHCLEGDSFPLPGLELWAYQFTTKAALSSGLTALNHDVNFRVVGSGGCPPTNGTDSASVGWQRGPDGPTLGTLECFTGAKTDSDVSYTNYIWTDSAELTIIDASNPGSFTDLSKWWRTNNNNGEGG